MQHGEFRIGGAFWCGGQCWRCTDIGARTIVAICIERVEVGSALPDQHRVLSHADAEADGWFNGPPYAVAEQVFDEDDIRSCSTVADAAPAPDDASAADLQTIRQQVRAGGLRFEAYLPPGLADWLLDQVERGVFTDPAEAVFVMLGEQQELEPHIDLREELLRRSCQAALDDPRPGIPHEEVIERLRQRLASPRPQAAVWRKSRI